MTTFDNISIDDRWVRFGDTFVRRYLGDQKQLRIWIDGEVKGIIMLHVLAVSGWSELHRVKISSDPLSIASGVTELANYADTLFR